MIPAPSGRVPPPDDSRTDRTSATTPADDTGRGSKRRAAAGAEGRHAYASRMGLYAEAVQRPGYRDAKMRTLLDTIPER
jgi:hypothetical protein